MKKKEQNKNKKAATETTTITIVIDINDDIACDIPLNPRIDEWFDKKRQLQILWYLMLNILLLWDQNHHITLVSWSSFTEEV